MQIGPADLPRSLVFYLVKSNFISVVCWRVVVGWPAGSPAEGWW